jgi:threonine synthase
MRFVSTRDRAHRVDLSTAIRRGLAPDGGLYVPERMPVVPLDRWPATTELREIGRVLLEPFFADDRLGAELDAVLADSFTFAAPLVDVDKAHEPLSVLELFHGPTAAFKDFGARFLAATLERIPRDQGSLTTILVATSGDTGGAVAAAFVDRPWVEVVVLYPAGLVSDRQAQQLACWGRNVRTLRVNGSFDDCQRLVKAAFADRALASARQLSSANSINIGRLLPQMVYYAAASLANWRRDQHAANFIVPSGNLGNVLACLWAREIGLPIGHVVMSTNANRTVTDFLRTGNWRPRPSVPTLASAMDVGDPSNMERLRTTFPGLGELADQVTATAIDDDEIRSTIRRDAAELGQVWCPHTATAAAAWHRLDARARESRWILVATAHPAKFNEIVEPLVGHTIAVPPALAALLELPRIETTIDATLDALRTQLA